LSAERKVLLAYVYVQDVAVSWEQYVQVASTLVDPLPEGLIVHTAGPTEEGVRIIDVWASEAAGKRFRTERLAPALAAFGGSSRLQPTFRDLHPRQVVLPDPSSRSRGS
jgi:hypothetical protein